uniref:Uncharacterized protein n=1 Tax=Anguilla anguilla TaxID=7936 RepID=A0A0E9QRD5_ANGAN
MRTVCSCTRQWRRRLQR